MARGLSEDQLAGHIGVSSVTLHLYEIGVADPSGHLAAIAAATETSVEWLAGEGADEVPEPEPEPEHEPEPEPEPESAAGPTVARVGGPLAANADVSGLTSIRRILQIGGGCLIVNTRDGREVRITASHDPKTGGFVTNYEAVRPQRWQSREILVWEETKEYAQGIGAQLEGAIEAALAAVDAGPRSPEELEADAVAQSDEMPVGDAEEESPPPRRFRLFRRKRG